VSSDLNKLDPAYLHRQLQLVAKRDGAAFRLLYDATSPKLFGFALRILRKPELAEEVLQESFVAVWNGAAGYQSHLSAPMTWMTTIVRNKAFDFLRRTDVALEIDAGQFNSEVMEAFEDPAATPIESLVLSSDAKALTHCMATLKGMQRQAIGLAFYHDLSHSEVAQQLAQPIGTIKTWIRRGLERLKLCLAKKEQE
jgi:RNA polymerase sigma factor (sigma-70 family)